MVLKRISDELHDLQQRLPLGLEPQSSPQQQACFTLSDVERLQEKLQSLSLSEQDLKKQQAILQSLTFESRPVRHTQIAMAHEKTFKWALTIDQDSVLGPSIGSWLKQGDGIFWVSGKPGSGKSTLMKYIADSSITPRFIAEWARPCRAAIVSHYFWIAGTTMQKSQQGLLQTLLYEIFRQCPDLIERTCMERWNSLEPGGPWSLVELHEALGTFVARPHATLKLCFIIDGLD
jgi:ATPase subunit of ABC transporter with duplicated ATPase domains